MIVCSCNVLSDREIRAAADGGELRTVSEVYRTMGGCDGQCHRCARSIRQILEEARHGCEDCVVVCRQRQDHAHSHAHPPVHGPAPMPLLEAAE